jgi:ribosomal protein S18 acetylase RimI-like enzyme
MRAFLKQRQTFLAFTKVLQYTQQNSVPQILSEKVPLPPQPVLSVDQDVRVCSLSEYKEVALSLAIAFADDPCAMFFINTADRKHWTAEQKWALHLEIMEYVVYAHMLDGVVTTVGENYGAVALWMPPGKDTDSHLTTFRSGLWRLHYRLSKIGHRRWFNDFMPLLHDTKHHVLGDRDSDSWYLVYLGTKPDARRKGLARALIEDVTSKADLDGLPVYLESSKESNVQIYEKFGFEERTKIWMGGKENSDSVPLNIMVREPWSH